MLYVLDYIMLYCLVPSFVIRRAYTVVKYRIARYMNINIYFLNQPQYTHSQLIKVGGRSGPQTAKPSGEAACLTIGVSQLT